MEDKLKECHICKDAGLDEEEYLQPDDEVGAETDKGWICDDCRDANQEERDPAIEHAQRSMEKAHGFI